MEMDWVKLGGLATTAILCLSPVIVWFEFRNKYINYINLLKSESFDTLENIRVELETMKVGPEGKDMIQISMITFGISLSGK